VTHTNRPPGGVPLGPVFFILGRRLRRVALLAAFSLFASSSFAATLTPPKAFGTCSAVCNASAHCDTPCRDGSGGPNTCAAIGDDCVPEPPPGVSTLVAPSGVINVRRPELVWNAATDAVTYLVFLRDPTSNVRHFDIPAGCERCRFTVPDRLASGGYEWWVVAENGGGRTPSAKLAFQIPIDAPPDEPPYGWHDTTSCSIIEGWTCDADAYAQPVAVDLFDRRPEAGGVLIATTTASWRREKGVADRCGGVHEHGFRIATPGWLQDGGPHEVYAYARDIGSGGRTLLENSGQAVNCGGVNRRPFGWIDAVTSDGVAGGWALDPDNVPAPISVHLYLDAPAGQGRFLGVAPANAPRPDVNQATGYAGDHGYAYLLPPDLRDGRDHTLYVYAIDSAGGTNPLLSGAPLAFNLAPNSPSIVMSGSFTPPGAPVGGYDSVSANPPPIRFFYDPSRGNFEQRPGGACHTGQNNPTYLKIRLQTTQPIQACSFQASWDAQPMPCQAPHLAAFNSGQWITLDTDTFAINPVTCAPFVPPVPILAPGQLGWFWIDATIGGQRYVRRINFVKER